MQITLYIKEKEDSKQKEQEWSKSQRRSLVPEFRREAVRVIRKLLPLRLGEEGTYPSCSGGAAQHLAQSPGCSQGCHSNAWHFRSAAVH